MKTILIITLSCITLAVNSQQVLPMVGGKKLVDPRTTSTTIVKETKDSVLISVDSTVTVSQETGHEDDKIFIMGIGGTDALSFDKLSIAGTFSAAFKIHPIWYSQVTFNYGNSVTETQSGDSVLLSELFFPDLSNAACAYSTEIIIGKPWGKAPNSKHSFVTGFDATLQRKQIDRKDTLYKIGVVNFTPGIKYRWMYRGREDVHSSLVIGAYWNFVAINESSSGTFNQLYNYSSSSEQIGRQFSGISFLISYQIQNSIFYARSFTDLSRSGDLAFSVGIKQAVTFKSY